MAEIPSNIAASAAQAGSQAREIAKGRDADRAGRAAAVREHAKAVDESGSTVETEDSDSAVFSDTEGAGSQGRAPEDSPQEPEPDTEEEPIPEGMVRGEDGELHLDMQA